MAQLMTGTAPDPRASDGSIGTASTAPGPPICLSKIDVTHVYYWNRMGRKGQLCRVIVRGKMNSCLVEFEDGYLAITSRNAVRKVKV